MRQIKLCRYETLDINICRTASTRLRVVAEEVMGGMDPDVFLWERLPLDESGNQEDVFQAIASPVDMEDLPSSQPDLAADPAYFRLNFVDFIIKTHEEAEELWEQIHQEVCELLQAMNRLDALRQTEAVWCRCGESVSSASSEFSAESAGIVGTGWLLESETAYWGLEANNDEPWLTEDSQT